MAIREELQGVLDAYTAAYRNKYAEGCAAVFTEDGELFSPYAPQARGRAEIEAVHREWLQLGGEDKQLSVVDAGSSGDLGWCLAAYSEANGTGTSLKVLHRQTDGRWLIRICSMNQET